MCCCALLLCIIIILYYIDIDECMESTGTCDRNADCKNTPGSFSCSCHSGYTGDGIFCAGNLLIKAVVLKISQLPRYFYQFKFLYLLDIDECMSPNVCHVNSTCLNSNGSFQCICNTGHTGNGSTCIGKFQKYV